MDTTKEGIKTYLETAASKANVEWHSQQAHKLAVALFFLDCLGIDDQETRNAVGKQWMATPSAFGCNSSAMGQALGRPKAAKVEASFADF